MSKDTETKYQILVLGIELSALRSPVSGHFQARPHSQCEPSDCVVYEVGTSYNSKEQLSESRPWHYISPFPPINTFTSNQLSRPTGTEVSFISLVRAEKSALLSSYSKNCCRTACHSSCRSELTRIVLKISKFRDYFIIWFSCW